MRELGVEECPCKVIPAETSVEKLRAYTIKDNNSFGEYDFDMLANDWEIDELLDWGCDLPDVAVEEEEPTSEEDDYSEEDANQAEPRVARGEIWQLGDHRLMCGDSTDGGDVALLMNGTKADMVFTDPPYGMKKEKEGVLNDNLNFDDLLDFNKKWIPLSFMFTKGNGSWYCWGIDEPLMDIYSEILKPMQKKKQITFRNYITWDKGVGQGQMLADYHLFAKSTEKCLFVMCGNATMSSGQFKTKEFFFEGFEKLRDYLRGELKKSGVSQSEIKKITNTYSSHYFAESQWCFPTEEHYNIIKQYCQQRHNQVFQKEYQELLPYFDNTHDNMNEVWQFARTSKKERELCGGHATPKPIELCSRAIKSSSRINEQVLDLFGGSGSTLIACEQLNRKCYMMELDEHYCDVIIDRWQKLTGKTAVKIEQQ